MQKIKQGVLLLMFVLTLAGCSVVNQSSDIGYKQISSQEAAQMMEEESDYIILDVRTAQEYEGSHIKGAINVPNESITEDNIAELPDKEQLILVYCRSGNRSKQASKKLADMGYTNIVEFGGINTWTGECEP